MSFTRRAFVALPSLARAGAASVLEKATPGHSALPAEPRLELVSNSGSPLITTRHPDAAGNKYGFEGGRVLKLGSTYHLFTSELVDDPIFVKMKLGYWRSGDGLDWNRISTIRESSGEFTGKDPRAALWAPMPVYDDAERRWNLFYVGYRAEKGPPEAFRANYDGQIWRAVSAVSGEEGIAGPYEDDRVVLSMGPDSDPWERSQGTDSFFAYRAGGVWYGLYGSAGLPLSKSSIPRTEKYWLVGLVSARHPAGPWKRMSAMNPLKIEKVFIENPVVTSLPNGGYLCVYDSGGWDMAGYAFSADGLHWQPGHHLIIQPRPRVWAGDVRTPLGLVPEGNNEYSLYYTGYEKTPDWKKLLLGVAAGVTMGIGLARVRLIDR